MSCKTGLTFLTSLFLLSATARAALPNPPKEDVHFVAEHLPEAGQDARYTSLPFLSERLEPGRWQQTLQVGYARTQAGDFLRLDGPMLAFNAGRGVSDRWGFSVLGFYDSMQVSGGSGELVLRPFFFRNVPLDLPERAEFSHPRGDYRHWGIGAAFLRELSPAGAPRRWTLTGGLLYDHLEIKNYQMDYRILSGASAGVRGILDHSSDVNFVTPYFGGQYSLPLGASFSLAPRIIVGAPLPPGDFGARLTGPGFDLSTARGDGKPGQIGDVFVGISGGLIHRRSGLEIDLGSTLFYPLLEKASHPGVSRSFLVQVAWHH
ncbi:MAG TPA: hypothetical protein VF173_19675 [Thermoanaerobaculia bacterium]|nr:hypothetical protein [Thermoanaerobaculia bacterium]